MSPFHDLGRILRDVYEQHQRQPQPPAQDEQAVPRLVGGLWAAFGFEEAAEKYEQRLEEQYGFLHILGHHKPVPLEGVFTDVYLYDRPLALRRLGVKELEDQFRQRRSEQRGTQRVDGLSLVRKERKLFILGQPGAGKTTFLKHIALQAAQGELPGVPIFVALKALADSELPLLNFMAQEMRICGFPEPVPFIQLMLKDGKLLILLDGLDEVTQAQETKLNLMQGIENVIRQYGGNHFLITCRTAVTDYQFPRFTSVEMADFSPEQVTVFIHKWFQDDVATGEACLVELKREGHQGLRDLARTPLLLNLLCLTYDEVGHFPERRVGLYEEALNALLVKWDSSRRIRRDEVYRHLDLGRKRHLLARIAAATFGEGKYFIPKDEMVRHILAYLQTIPGSEQLSDSDGEAVLQAIEAQHGILVERARGVYGFAHLTFQEYFTAKYVAEMGEKAWVNLFPHYTKGQWREVFLLTISLLSEGDDFFSRFCGHLEQRVNQDAGLVALLAWANNKAEQGRKAAQAQLLDRCLYIYIYHAHARAHARALDHALDLTHAHAFVFTLALALAQDHAHARALDHTHDLAHDLANDFAHARDFALTCDLARDLARALGHSLSSHLALDFALFYGWLYGRYGYGLAEPFMELSSRISQGLGLRSLHSDLAKLTIPGRNAPWEQRKQFAAVLWQIAQQERQLERFELNEEQADRLADYLQGTILLVECLKLAAVQDREGILARLLVAPGA